MSSKKAEKNPQKVEAGRLSALARKQKEADLLERLARLEALEENKRLDVLEEVKKHNLGGDEDVKCPAGRSETAVTTASTTRPAMSEVSWTPWLIGGGLGLVTIIYIAYGQKEKFLQLKKNPPPRSSPMTADRAKQGDIPEKTPRTSNPYWHGAK